MRVARTILVVLLLGLAAGAPASSQTSSGEGESLDIAQVRKSRADAESLTDEDLRARVLEQYDAAIATIERIAQDRQEKARLSRDTAGVDREIEGLKAELERAVPRPWESYTDDVSMEQAESELERALARLAARRERLRDVEKRVEERSAARNEIARKLGALDQEIEGLEDELRALRQSELPDELRVATEIRIRASKEAVRSRMEVYRTELNWLEAIGRVLPWEVDVEQRNTTISEQAVATLERRARRLRRRESRAALERALETCGKAVEIAPDLAAVAEETRELARDRWDTDNIAARTDRVTTELLRTQGHLDELDRVIQLTRRLFEAYGQRGSIQRWWPELPDGFPDPSELRRNIRSIRLEHPEVQHALIRIEQRRSASRALTDETLRQLADEDGGIDPQVERVALTLLNLRRDLLDELIVLAGRYSARLAEHEAAQQHLLDQIGDVERFLYEHLLWSRSVPRPVLPSIEATRAAASRLVSADNRAKIRQAIIGGSPTGRPLALALCAVVLLGFRKRMLARLRMLGERVSAERGAPFRWTLEAFVHTVLLAAPIPLLILAVAERSGRMSGSLIADALTRSLVYTAAIVGLFTTARWLVAPYGLGRAHFGWTTEALARVHRGLRPTAALFVPFMGLALFIGFVGASLASPSELQAHHNSLGRIAFMMAFAVLGISLAILARPRLDRATGSLVRRSDLGANLLVVVITVVPVVLAASGYYITSILLAYQWFRIAWLALALVLVGGLLFRWHDASSREASEGEDPAEARAARGQARSVIRFSIIVVAAIGLYGIWSDALPLLQALKRVQVWPSIGITAYEPDPFPTITSGRPSREATASTGETPQTGDAVQPTLPRTGAASSEAERTDAATTSTLTLWNLLQAIFVALVVVALARNLPGLVDLVLRQRRGIDRGARIALSTLVRYTVLIVGVSAVFGLLGVSWSKIQWLAAALTFGLGFGLQEIVANFVSGLILLLERPVRVGDAVTIGNLQGIVSKIQIRATTITLWDRSEMVVPNKEFITTKLINWTLSDSRRRSEIPLRIAYGSEIDMVKQTLVEVARANPNVLDEPAPHVLLLNFADDAIQLELRFFVDFGQGLSTKDALLVAIDRAFRERGIEFAMPRLNIDVGRQHRLRVDHRSGDSRTPGKT